MAISFSEELLCRLSDFSQKYLVRHSLRRVLEWDSFKAEEDFWQRQKDKRKINSGVQGLEKGGYVKKIKREGKLLLQITPKGTAKILRAKIKGLDVRRGAWDGKWRIVIFDIPESARNKRRLFRSVIGNLEFKQLQKSVWVSPYDVLTEAEALTKELSLDDYAHFIIADKISGQETLIAKFFPQKSSKK